MATGFLLLGFLLLQGCWGVIVDVSPRESVVLPNQNVTFLCRVGVPLQYCRVEIPGLGTFNLNNKLSPRGGVSYSGAGLSAGQCGFTIDRVDDNNNGKVKCFLGLETDYQEPVGTMQLTVARPPKTPELDLSRGTDSLRVYKIHDILHASCIVKDGRPVANISWYLDDEPILGDGLSMPTIIDLAKEDLHSKVQNLTRTLQPSDNGKLLKCVATHPALYDKNVAARQLDVKYPPQGANNGNNPIDKFGYEIGKPGVISVEFSANPKPQLEWTVREQRIREGSIDSTGRIEAETAQDMGRGNYIANLRLAAINKQDTQTQFILTAYNDMGTQDYTILISTSPEPEGVDIGVGTIVAIIISVLLLLVIVFIVVFARIKGRWCFSAPQENRAVGESSDTESANTCPKERKRRILPPLKLTKPNINMNIFKKNRDKVAHEDDETKTMETEAADDDVKVPLEQTPVPATEEVAKEEEPKEGIVYAELDLVRQNIRPMVKNDDDKTEYAEIVYTGGEKKEEEKKA